MDREVKYSVDLICSFLYDSLPRLRIEALKDELKRIIKGKIKTTRSEFYTLNVSGLDPDPSLIPAAAKAVYLDANEIFLYLDRTQFTIWIRSGYVLFRIGTRTDFKLFEDNFDELKDLSSESPTFLIDAITNTIVEKSFFSSSEDFSRSSSVSPYQDCLGKLNDPDDFFISNSNNSTTSDNGSSAFNSNYMTAGIFAQTKFGSTKLRNPNLSASSVPTTTTTLTTSSHSKIILKDPPLVLKGNKSQKPTSCITTPSTSSAGNSSNDLIYKQIDNEFNNAINRINIF